MKLYSLKIKQNLSLKSRLSEHWDTLQDFFKWIPAEKKLVWKKWPNLKTWRVLRMIYGGKCELKLMGGSYYYYYYFLSLEILGLENYQVVLTSCCCLVAESYLTLLWPPWTLVHQAPLSMGFSRQEYWCGLPFPSPVLTP